MIPEPLSSVACCLRLGACSDQPLHTSGSMDHSTNRLIPGPAYPKGNSLFGYRYLAYKQDQGSGRLSVYPGKLIPDPLTVAPILVANGSGISGLYSGSNFSSRNPANLSFLIPHISKGEPLLYIT